MMKKIPTIIIFSLLLISLTGCNYQTEKSIKTEDLLSQMPQKLILTDLIGGLFQYAYDSKTNTYQITKSIEHSEKVRHVFKIENREFFASAKQISDFLVY